MFSIMCQFDQAMLIWFSVRTTLCAFVAKLCAGHLPCGDGVNNPVLISGVCRRRISKPTQKVNNHFNKRITLNCNARKSKVVISIGMYIYIYLYGAIDIFFYEVTRTICVNERMENALTLTK